MAKRRNEEYATNSQHPFPYVTEDGMTWLDAWTSEPAESDEAGRLTKPFVLELVTGARERWGIGMKLPVTPLAWQRIVNSIKKPETGK